MGDRWDEIAAMIVESAEPGQKADARVFAGVVSTVGRTFEQMGADLDRIATALEKSVK